MTISRLVIERCENCAHFDRPIVLVRGELWSDDLIAVPAMKGVCRATPPQPSFWGSRWPAVTASDRCGQFSPSRQALTGEGQ